MIRISDSASHKLIWEREVYITNPMKFKLHLAPDKKHAVLAFFFNPHLGPELFWISISADGFPSQNVDMDFENFPKTAAKICGTPESLMRFFSFDYLKWKSDAICLLKWECLVYDKDGGDDKHHVGVVGFTLDAEGNQKINSINYLSNLSDEKYWRVQYGSSVILGP
jgi:hypothetical protein